jgi:hypothetical protein
VGSSSVSSTGTYAASANSHQPRDTTIGAETLLKLLEESTSYCMAHPGTNATKHFAYMIDHRRSGEGRRKV